MPVKSEDMARASSKGSVRAGTAERLSRADRVARGKDARALAPLESHAEFTPDRSRDPVCYGVRRGWHGSQGLVLHAVHGGFLFSLSGAGQAGRTTLDPVPTW